MNGYRPPSDGHRIEVPEDDEAVREHARDLLRKRGFNCEQVVRVHSAGHPMAVCGSDTILYVNSQGETRHALLWREGSKNRTLKIETYDGWPVAKA